MFSETRDYKSTMWYLAFVASVPYFAFGIEYSNIVLQTAASWYVNGAVIMFFLFSLLIYTTGTSLLEGGEAVLVERYPTANNSVNESVNARKITSLGAIRMWLFALLLILALAWLIPFIKNDYMLSATATIGSLILLHTGAMRAFTVMHSVMVGRLLAQIDKDIADGNANSADVDESFQKLSDAIKSKIEDNADE